MNHAISPKPGSNDIGFHVFLTAYDPSDLPGGSLDPLGFDRGYLFLADKILPGLTNVAERPRYFSMLCAGASLAEIDVIDPPRIQYQKRLDCIQRLERFWALANVLASQQTGGENLPVSGIRGVTYASDKAETVIRQNVRRVDASFKMLSRQVPYGVIGIYGAVANGMRLLDRKTLTLTPDLGERLAEGFLTETSAPPVLLKAVRDDGDLPVNALREWGLRAHISGEALPTERLCWTEALNRDPIRCRMAEVLADHPVQGVGDTELQRLARLLPSLRGDLSNRDLGEAVAAILAYEVCYRLVLLGFERLLWLCRTLPSAAISNSELSSDTVLQLVCVQLPAASIQFGRTLDSAQTEQFRIEIDRLEDTRRFLESAAASCSSPASLAREIMARHSHVQGDKSDRGRRKMPWLEVASGHIGLTMTRVGGLTREATVPADIGPHPYRLSSADALIVPVES